MDTKNIQIAFNSFLDEKVSRLDKNHKIAICAAGVIIPLVVFYFFFFSPKSKQIKGLEASISSLQTELQRVKLEAGKMAEQEALMKEMEIKFKEAAKVMPDNKEIPSLLTNISNQGTASGLDILSFAPGAESPKEFYAEIPVSLSVEGTYHNLGYFLDTVSKLPRIVNVSNIAMGGPKMEDGEMMLNTRVSLVTYKFIEPIDASKGK